MEPKRRIIDGEPGVVEKTVEHNLFLKTVNYPGDGDDDDLINLNGAKTIKLGRLQATTHPEEQQQRR